MKKSLMVAASVCVIAAAAALSCRQSDMKLVTIDVPQMADATSVRIVTNAALNEVVARNDGIQNGFEADLASKTVRYHESRHLLSPDYQKRIEARLAEVGLQARVTQVKPNPPPLFPTPDGPVQIWPDRCTAVISIPGLKGITEANIAVDAIAYARLGKDDPRISVDARGRKVVVAYESLHLSPKNIELAIACVGFDANKLPARLGQADALPHDWRAFDL